MAGAHAGLMGPCGTKPLTSRQAGFVRGASLRAPEVRVRAAPTSFVVSAKYRGEGADRSKVPQFQRNENDTGSPEVQIALLSSRVEQLTEHLKVQQKDFSSERGLKRILSKRKKLLRYLYNSDREKFNEVVTKLGIRFSSVQFS